jgi:hypothetical protein
MGDLILRSHKRQQAAIHMNSVKCTTKSRSQCHSGSVGADMQVHVIIASSEARVARQAVQSQLAHVASCM